MAQGPGTWIPHTPQTLKALLSRERAVLVAGLVGISVGGWVYSLSLFSGATHEPFGADKWSLVSFAMVFVMWSFMMMAMMVPSAAPAIFDVCNARAGSE